MSYNLMHRRGLLLATFAAVTLVASAIARTFQQGLLLDEEKQWAHVQAHERFFKQALQSGTAAEADDV